MAPEVLEGRGASVLADQFAFCVALYEGLIGHRPFEATTFGGLRRAVAQGPPRNVSPPRGLPPALLRIVVRGLALDPRERHPSMDALLRSLHRSTRPRRVRRSTAALSLVGLAALGWTFAPTQPATTDAGPRSVETKPDPREVRLGRALDEAAELEDASRRRARVVEIRRKAVELGLGGVQARAALRLGLDSVEADALDQAQAELEEAFHLAQQHVQSDVARDAALHLALEVHLNRHELEAADRWLRHTRSYLELAPNPQRELELTRARARLSLETGDPREAERILRRALESQSAGRSDRALLRLSLAEILVWTRRPRRAERHVEEALESGLEDPVERARALVVLGHVYVYTHRYEQAARALETSVDLYRDRYGDDSIQVTVGWNALATAYFALHRTDEALELLDRLRRVTIAAKGPNHPDVATIDVNTAFRYFDLGRYERAVRAAERGLDTLRSIGAFSPEGLFHLHRVIGESWLALENLDQAEFAFRRLLLELEGRDDPLQRGYAQAGLGMVAAARGDHRVALEHYASAGNLYVDRPETSVEAAARIRVAHADSLWALGRRREARQLVAMAMASIGASAEHSRDQNLSELGRWLDERSTER